MTFEIVQRFQMCLSGSLCAVVLRRKDCPSYDACPPKLRIFKLRRRVRVGLNRSPNFFKPLYAVF